MKYTFIFEGDTLSYNNEASKKVTVSFENPAGQKVILDEFLNFLKAAGEYVPNNAQLKLEEGFKLNLDEINSGYKIDFTGLREKNFIGPEDC